MFVTNLPFAQYIGLKQSLKLVKGEEGSPPYKVVLTIDYYEERVEGEAGHTMHPITEEYDFENYEDAEACYIHEWSKLPKTDSQKAVEHHVIQETRRMMGFSDTLNLEMLSGLNPAAVAMWQKASEELSQEQNPPPRDTTRG